MRARIKMRLRTYNTCVIRRLDGGAANYNKEEIFLAQYPKVKKVNLGKQKLINI